MKRIKGVLFAFCVCMVCLLLLTACSKKLAAPASFRLDEATLMLHWNKVNSASAYVIEIGDGISYTTRENAYSLENLSPGEYVIKVRAISYSKDYEESDPAEYAFKRVQESGLQYELSENRNSYVLVGIGTASGDVVMEDYYRGKPVTAIDKAALRRCNELTSFVVGSQVTSIGENAFYACAELTSITLPAGLKQIGEGAFQSCTKLESITIPDGVTAIAPYTFSMCKGLREVSMGSAVTNVGMYAFSDCLVLESVSMPNTIERLEEYAFSGCLALRQVSFSENLKTIGQYAFFGCGALTELNLNNSLEQIGQGAFSECGITELILPENLSSIGILAFSNCAALERVQLNANLKEIGFDAFIETALMKNCTEDVLIIDDWIVAAMTLKTSEETKSYDVPENVVGIANGAFAYCKYLQRIKMEKVQYIGQMTFAYCSSLWQVICGEALLQIDSYAFMFCEQLTNVYLGDCVERICDYAFFNCERLEDGGIDLPKTLKEMGCGVFNGTRLYNDDSDNGLVYVDDWLVGSQTGAYYTGAYVKEGTRGICNYAFQYAMFVDRQLYLPNTVEIIGKGAFYKNTTLQLLNFPRNLKYIGDYAFANTAIQFGDNGLTEIPKGCEYLGDCAFRYCTGVATLSVPGTIKHIGNYAFMGCSNLGVLLTDENDETVVLLNATVTLQEGIETIGVRAFYGCTALRGIALPDSLQDLGAYAFYNCASLSLIDFGVGLEEIKAYTFGKCTSLKEISIPGTIRTIGEHAFRGCTSAEKIVLGEGVETVADYAFAYCEDVVYLSMNDSITHIGNFAFRGMPALEAVYLSETVSYVGRLAFYGSHNATIYYEGTQLPAAWDARWNAAYSPVALGTELTQENNCVVAWTAAENGLLNMSGFTQLSAPCREGFVFVGWSSSPDASAGQYATLGEVPVGTTVYPVWTVSVAEAPEQSETPDQNQN